MTLTQLEPGSYAELSSSSDTRALNQLPNIPKKAASHGKQQFAFHMKHADPMEGQSNSPSALLHTRKRMVHRVETGRRVVRRRHVCQSLSLPSFRLSQHLDESHPHLVTHVGVERTFHPWGPINLIITAPSFHAVKLRHSNCAHPRPPSLDAPFPLEHIPCPLPHALATFTAAHLFCARTWPGNGARQR
jgi:hypothetical protein